MKTLQNIPTNEIICEKRILSEDKENIKNLSLSINEIGLINPIIISIDKKLICGFDRLQAFKNLGIKTIPCFIHTDKNINTKILEISENLERKHLSKLEIAYLTHFKKKEYELQNPTSTKSAKSANNGKSEENRDELIPSYSKVEAENRGCSERIIQQQNQLIEKFLKFNPHSIKILFDYEKALKTRIPGVLLNKLSNLEPNEFEGILDIVKTAIKDKNTKFSLKEVLLNKNEILSRQEQLRLILKYDLSMALGKKTDFDNETIKSIKTYKQNLNINFLDTIKEILA